MTALPIHKDFVDNVIHHTKQDKRIVGVAMGGSWLSGNMDEFSDLDFVIVYDPAYREEMMDHRGTFAEQFGDLLSWFTGEHVGEPRLIVSLYNDPLLHVDYKFITPEELADRVEDPAILWERSHALTEVVQKTESSFPSPDFQWIENRFWKWIHYSAAKLGRGELFELIGTIHNLNARIIAPMVKIKNGFEPTGMRHLEEQAGEYYERLVACAPSHDAKECAVALHTLVELYDELQTEVVGDDVERLERTREACVAYLYRVTDGILK